MANDVVDVIIVRPNSASWEGESYLRVITIPHGPLTLASHLLNHGISVAIIDETAEDDAERRLRDLLACGPVCVGISSMTGKQLENGLRFANIVRNFDSGIPIVWGGAHLSILPELALDESLVDFVVYGEGDVSFVELVQQLMNGKDFSRVNGIGYKENGTGLINPPNPAYDISQLPRLPYDLIDMEKYISGITKKNITRYFEVVTSRGCPYKCTFCTNSIDQMIYTRSSVDRIIDEIKCLIDNYGVDGIGFSDENFLINKKYVTSICEALIREGINIHIRASGRIDLFAKLDDALLELLKEAGVYFIAFGVESGSPETLKLMNKTFKLEHVLEVVEKVNEHGFIAGYNFLGGVPGETLTEFSKTLQLIYDVFRLGDGMVYPIRISNFVPFPGTVMYQAAINSGFKPPVNFYEWASYDYNHVNMPWLTEDFIKILIESKKVVTEINQLFTGDDTLISDKDLYPILELAQKAEYLASHA